MELVDQILSDSPSNVESKAEKAQDIEKIEELNWQSANVNAEQDYQRNVRLN